MHNPPCYMPRRGIRIPIRYTEGANRTPNCVVGYYCFVFFCTIFSKRGYVVWVSFWGALGDAARNVSARAMNAARDDTSSSIGSVHGTFAKLSQAIHSLAGINAGHNFARALSCSGFDLSSRSSVCVFGEPTAFLPPPPLHPLYTMRGELILFSPSFCLLWTTQQCEDLAMDETQQKCVKMCEAIKKKIVDSSEIWILKTVLHYEKERFEINRII